MAAADTKEHRGPLPAIVVFDLDACCWSPEMYQLWGGGSPFTYDAETNSCTDRAGVVCRLFEAIPTAWSLVADSPNSRLAIASRCDEPKWADEILRKFKIANGLTMMEAVDDNLVEIYKSSKKVHLTAIRDKSGVAFSDMLFFDDDPANIRDVSELGVCSILTPNGVDEEAWLGGLATFAAK
mmetsp:Transcript_18213/g.33057  ORF Transcript_18213/g.33057 Transcript_18213/m.33057 type:complete len:182 (-) Transcript_18213:79-624(-)|eukprot:CAMPEP_0205903700 /NCGR_PEP_ID=MMETSP1325-20131115/265_1 /ASSEMBLY_ACC=CAM_ASM_000708 /TAXON_ID=236786 /ORGANISM="Florenciella sp., Strain RCC1007" /LENGTH=181 /DNA_ID=CAMNT_0053269377 /DNA_START=142 /DNA_END=687 /DNA_ORIENTATION=+